MNRSHTSIVGYSLKVLDPFPDDCSHFVHLSLNSDNLFTSCPLTDCARRRPFTVRVAISLIPFLASHACSSNRVVNLVGETTENSIASVSNTNQLVISAFEDARTCSTSSTFGVKVSRDSLISPIPPFSMTSEQVFQTPSTRSFTFSNEAFTLSTSDIQD